MPPAKKKPAHWRAENLAGMRLHRLPVAVVSTLCPLPHHRRGAGRLSRCAGPCPARGRTPGQGRRPCCAVAAAARIDDHGQCTTRRQRIRLRVGLRGSYQGLAFASFSTSFGSRFADSDLSFYASRLSCRSCTRNGIRDRGTHRRRQRRELHVLDRHVRAVRDARGRRIDRRFGVRAFIAVVDAQVRLGFGKVQHVRFLEGWQPHRFAKCSKRSKMTSRPSSRKSNETP